MGESIAEGTIVKWHKSIGDMVKKDETLLEISTDKVDSEIPSPAAGVLVEIVAKENDTVPVHTVIAYLDSNGAGAPKNVETPGKEPPAVRPSEATQTPQAAAKPAPAVPPPAGNRFYSPLVMTIARAEGVSMSELEQIPGTGEGGGFPRTIFLGGFRERRRAAWSPGRRHRPPPRRASSTSSNTRTMRIWPGNIRRPILRSSR